jgi:predicted nucleic acid-binding protein
VRIFFDSSAFAKRYVTEPGSQTVDELCAKATIIAIGVLCVPEIISALNRRLREKRLSPQNYAAIKQRFAEDVRDAVVVNLTPSVISAGITILEGTSIRALDALHVACAMEWNTELFVSADKQQLAAARKAGLRTESV